MTSWREKLRFRPRRQRGRIRLGDIVFVGVIVGAIIFVDWDSVFAKLSLDAYGAQAIELANLSCEVREGGPTRSGLPGAAKSYVSGTIKNVGEQTLSLSVRIDYVFEGSLADHRYPGTRIEPVRPREIAPGATGRFSLEETVGRDFIATRCEVQFRDDAGNRWIAIEDQGT